jgi:hypothetical protein
MKQHKCKGNSVGLRPTATEETALLNLLPPHEGRRDSSDSSPGSGSRALMAFYWNILLSIFTLLAAVSITMEKG